MKKKNKVENKQYSDAEIRKLIHARGDLRVGISQIRRTIKNKQIPALVRFLMKQNIYSSAVIGNPFPPLYKDIVVKPPMAFVSTEVELLWNVNILASYKDKIGNFIKEKNEFEHLFLLGKYEDATKILERVNENFGVSLWLMENKFQILQLHQGLKAQKDELEKILGHLEIDSRMALFPYMFSFRCEGDVTLNELEDWIARIEPKVEEGPLNYYRYQLIPFDPTLIKDPARALTISEFSPIIDRYLCLKLCLLILIIRDEEKNNKYIDQLREILIDDDESQHRLIELFEGSLTQTENDTFILDIYDEYTKGNYEDVCDAIEKRLIEDSKACCLYEIYIRAISYTDRKINFDTDSLIFKIFEGMKKILHLEKDYLAAVDDLKKIVLSCSHHAVSIQLAAFLARTHSFVLVEKYTELDALWALQAPYINPWHSEILSSVSDNDKLLEKIVSDNPKSISMKLRYYLQKSNEDSESKIIALNLPDDRKQLYLGHLDMMRERFTEAINHYCEAVNSLSAITKFEASKHLSRAYLALGKIEPCIKLISNSYLENRNSYTLFPIEMLLEELKNKKNQIKPSLDLAIVYYIATKHISQKYESFLSNSYEDYLYVNDYTKPSQLSLSDYEGDELDKVLFFFSEICTIRTLEDSIEFEDYQDVEQERINICRILGNCGYEGGVDYENEITQLTHAAEVNALMQIVDESRIHVDVAAILQKNETTIKNYFSRYSRLSNLPDINYQAQAINKILGKLLSHKVNIDIKNFNLPSTERESLFQTIYKTLLSLFLISPEFGLKIHVETQIRHGKLVGQFRTCFASKKLLYSQKDLADKNSDKYKALIDEYKSLSENELNTLVDSLQVFSEKINSYLNFVKDEWICIKDEENPEGLFNFEFSDEEISELMNSMKPDVEYSDFVKTLIDSYWLRLEKCLEVIQVRLRTEVQKYVNTQLGKLEDSLRSITSGKNLSHLLDSLSLSRTDFQNSLEIVCKWFQRPQNNLQTPFSLSHAITAARSEAGNYFTTQFPIEVNSSIEIPYLFKPNCFRGFIEVFYVLFQNAIIYSDLVDERIHIEIAAIKDNGYLIIQFKNNFNVRKNIDVLKQSLSTAKERYYAQTAVEMAQKNKNSGFPKIRRILDHVFVVDHDLDLDVLDNHVVVTLKLNELNLKA